MIQLRAQAPSRGAADYHRALEGPCHGVFFLLLREMLAGSSYDFVGTFQDGVASLLWSREPIRFEDFSAREGVYTCYDFIFLGLDGAAGVFRKGECNRLSQTALVACCTYNVARSLCWHRRHGSGEQHMQLSLPYATWTRVLLLSRCAVGTEVV